MNFIYHNFILKVRGQESSHITYRFRIKMNLTEFYYANYKLNDLSKTVN